MDEKPGQQRNDIPQSAGLSTRPELEISQAIQACGAKCMDSDAPIRCIEIYVIALVANGWSPADATAVQRGTMRVLATIKHDDSLLPPPKEPPATLS